MKAIEKKYRKLDDIEHCLLRPGMYIGSTKTRIQESYVLNENGKFVSKPIKFNPGFLKLFDEIISNSADEHRRNKKLNRIDVTTSLDTGRITIRDNGGIPVVKHSKHDEYVPEMIFFKSKSWLKLR